MKILLIAGHGAGDPGAVGVNKYKEADFTREVVNNVKPLLSKYATVEVYPTSRSCIKDIRNGVNQVNFANYDYVLEVHFNAGGGTGTEIYVTSSEKGTSVEQSIVNSLSKYYKNRGVKRNDWLVIKTAKNKGVSSALLEVCFIDSVNDVNVYTKNKKAIAQCIVDGVVSGFGLKGQNKADTTTNNKTNTNTSTTSKTSQNELYKVQITANVLNVRSGAGTNYPVVTAVKKNEVYTIVEEKNGWGKLKSGAGWISLVYTTKNTTANKSKYKPLKTTIKKLYLPASATKWGIYKTNVKPVTKNIFAYLYPSKFGGLTYDILATPYKDVVTIQTRDYGKVNIYVAPSTGAVIK